MTDSSVQTDRPAMNKQNLDILSSTKQSFHRNLFTGVSSSFPSIRHRFASRRESVSLRFSICEYRRKPAAPHLSPSTDITLPCAALGNLVHERDLECRRLISMLPEKADRDYIHHIEHSDDDETLGACSTHSIPRASLVILSEMSASTSGMSQDGCPTTWIHCTCLLVCMLRTATLH